LRNRIYDRFDKKKIDRKRETNNKRKNADAERCCPLASTVFYFGVVH